MAMPEFDNRIKRALVCKANEIQPSDEIFSKILAGLEKKQAHCPLTKSSKYGLIALICAVSLLAGSLLIIPLDLKTSALELINGAKTVFTFDQNSQVTEKKGDGAFNHPTKDNTRFGNDGSSRKVCLNAFLLQTLMNQVPDLELYLRLLLIGKLISGQVPVNKFRESGFLNRKVLAYQ